MTLQIRKNKLPKQEKYQVIISSHTLATPPKVRNVIEVAATLLAQVPTLIHLTYVIVNIESIRILVK